MGIMHLEDLPVNQILELLDLDWSASQKLDGSYLKLGLDDTGAPYVARKGGPPIYSLDEWPAECWTAGFRPAHLTALFFLEELKLAGGIKAGEYFGAEIINGNQPNVCEYASTFGAKGVIWITTSNFTLPPSIYHIVTRFNAEFEYYHPSSEDGKDITWTPLKVQWIIMPNPSIERSRVVKLRNRTSHIADAMKFFLASNSNVQGYKVKDILELNLNKSPRDIRAQLKSEREAVRVNWYNLVMTYKHIISSQIVTSISRYARMPPEGIVIEGSDFYCKVTDRKNFTQLNTFVHRIKYMLVGGRRPARPCFLSRTKDWPLEKRVARLEVLRHRYLNHYEELRYHYELFGSTGTMFYSGDLHIRMLGLFADTRKRIIDGR